MFLPGFVLAQDCPSRTTVSGNAVTFVGELTDMGGDETTSVWFEYGKTTSYGQKTIEKVLTRPGFYCITVSGLTPATYNYRAAARNSAGTGHGANNTFVISPSPDITVSIKANNSDGPISIPYNSSATLTWTSKNADSCQASNAWSGVKPTSGSQSTGSLTGSRTYTIACEGPGGFSSDSVTVNVQAETALSVSLSANPNTGCVPLNNVSLKAEVSGTGSGNITYYFDCTNNGIWNGIYTSSSKSYTASRICSYPSVGSYTAKVKAERGGEVSIDTKNIKVYSCTDSPTVSIKANNSDGPITVPYNSSATLTWTSKNADSCQASNAWSGVKPTSGSQSTGSLTGSRTYTIACEGPGGFSSDSVTVNVQAEVSTDFYLRKTVRNLSRGTAYSDLIHAIPGETLIFAIVVRADKEPLYDVVVKDTLPAGLLYRGELKIDDVITKGDVFSGYKIDYIPFGERKVITFKADVAGEKSFSLGQTRLVNTALASAHNSSRSDTAEVIVSRAAVAGVATDITTGWTNNLFLDSFFFPLAASLFVIWILKSRIIRLEEWLDKRKRKYQEYKSKKMLKIKVAKIKFREAVNS